MRDKETSERIEQLVIAQLAARQKRLNLRILRNGNHLGKTHVRTGQQKLLTENIETP